jgi:2Fe-2S ferredoxin
MISKDRSIIIFPNGGAAEAVPGDTILSAMKRGAGTILSVCGGRGMCGTCRVAIEAPWQDRLTPPAPPEARLLGVLKARQSNHRLACQVVLDAGHDGLRFVLCPPPTRQPQQETPI